MGGGQVVFPKNHLAVGAHRTARSLGPGLHRRLPAVTLGAAPPGFLVAAKAQVLGREGGVGFYIPLFQQGSIPLLHTVVVECLFHRTTGLSRHAFGQKQYFDF